MQVKLSLWAIAPIRLMADAEIQILSAMRLEHTPIQTIWRGS